MEHQPSNPADSNWPSNHPPEQSTLAVSDEEAGIETSEDFQRFSQKNDMFQRAFWDPEVTSDQTRGFFESYRMEASPRRGEGFNQRDFAIRNAAWSVADDYADRSMDEGMREGFSAPLKPRTDVFAERQVFESTAAMTEEVKNICRLMGADLVGVAEYDPRWTYQYRSDSRDFSDAPNEVPETVSHVIVLGHGMDYDLTQTYPSALAGAATGLAYSAEAAASVQICAYIRNLGYEAIASMNDTALVIPYAVKAGLGEYGRNQMVLTPEFGPRVRFSKIFTDMPLDLDRPKKFGGAELCGVCTRCADGCPPKALPYGPPSYDRPNQSTISGVKKWSADCEKCFGYWAKLKSDCAICMRVCPWNRDYTKLINRLMRKLLGSRFKKLALWLDAKIGDHQRSRPRDWWAIAAGNPPGGEEAK